MTWSSINVKIVVCSYFLIFNQLLKIFMQTAQTYEWPIYSRCLFHHETDADGVCHFSNYFRIAEEALFSALRSLGFSLIDDTSSLVILYASANYKAPLIFDKKFQVVLRNLEIRRAKFEVRLLVISDGCDQNAHLQLSVARISRQIGNIIPLTPELRLRLESIRQKLISSIDAKN